MRRADLEHVLRAAAAVAEDDEIVVIGSQAPLPAAQRTRIARLLRSIAAAA